VPAFAQQTREEEQAAARAEKAKDLHPYVPTATERLIARAEQAFMNPPPVYVFLGSIFRGGWLAAGPGYRGSFKESGAFDMHAAWSLKNYKTADASVKLPQFADGQLKVDARANWIDAPSVAFYGIGNDMQAAQKTSFLYRTTTAGFTGRFQPAPLVGIGGGVDAFLTDSGTGRRGTSIENLFSAASTPGFGSSPRYTRTRLFAEVDSRTSPGYTRTGGLYRLDWADYHQTNNGAYGFRRLDAEADHFIPLLRENWVIALRALMSTTDVDPGHAVPYFLMPDLGGSSELRGYPSWRFRDRHRLLFTGEYRWMGGQFSDMELFLDAGKVAATRSDIDLQDLRKTYGIGVRFHTPNATAMRVEVAHTAEGLGIIVSFGQLF